MYVSVCASQEEQAKVGIFLFVIKKYGNRRL